MSLHVKVPKSSFGEALELAVPGPIRIGHEGQEPLPALEYFDDTCTDQEERIMSRLFLDDSTWNLNPHTAPLDQATLGPRGLAATLLAGTHDVYTLAQQSIAQINWFGYNDHGPLHIRRVVEDALRLGESADFSNGQLRRLVAAAAFHDLGNLVNRDVHSFESPSIAAAIFPELRDDERSWRTIERAIQLHEIGAQKLFLPGDYAALDSARRIQALQDVFGPEALALVVADKIQFSRERVNERALSVPALMAHRYSQLSFYWQTDSAEFSPETRTFEWKLRFRPDIQGSEYHRFRNLAEATGDWHVPYKAVLPPGVQEGSKDPFQWAEDLFWSLSEKLVQRLAECSFALWNSSKEGSLNTFVISLSERGAAGAVDQGVQYSVDISRIADGVRQNRREFR
jgi:hypothetical protein